MGYSNGTLSLNKAQKGEKGNIGQGKAGTTYVNEELAKKANTSSLSDYAKKNEVDHLLLKSYF